MKAQCNECYEISSIIPRKKRLRNKIDKHYYRCDHCGHIYVIGYTDDFIRRERNRLNKLNKKNVGNELYEDKIKEKTKLIESKMNELKESIEAST